MASCVIWITRLVVFIYLNQVASSLISVKRVQEGFTLVPQDVTPDVTHLKLDKNAIEVLYNTSVSQYERLILLSVSYNPLWRISNGTFHNNPSLKQFRCSSCIIRVLPASFGPATSKIHHVAMDFSMSQYAMFDHYFDSFISLNFLALTSIRLSSINSMIFPPSIKTILLSRSGISQFPYVSDVKFPVLKILGLTYNNITQFPNVSSARFPVLEDINLNFNYITHISNSALAGMSDTVISLLLYGNNLMTIGDVTVLTNLEYLNVRQNQLKTIPDVLLGLPRLRWLYIGDSTRMFCDHRMCWRRLWDRVRSSMGSEDDVMCMAPSAARGHRLSMINPGLMQCDQGGGWDYWTFPGS